MKLVLAVILLVSAAAAEKFFAEPTERCCVDYCYSTDTVRPQNLHYNTKTAYQFVRGGQSPSVPADCTPSKFWLLTRHGTRLPSSSKIEKLQGLPTYQAEILSNYAGGKKPAVGALCDADLQLLASWQLDNNITVSMDEYLTQQGWNDLKGLATHYKGLYPTLLGGSYSADRFVFRHTNTQRTQASYRGFVDGLFGDGFHTSITPPIVPTVDTFLKPYEYCKAWTDQEDALEKSSSELYKFENGALYNSVVDDVSTKAGYSSPLKANRIEWMFEQCFYDLSWELSKPSPWCVLFTLEQTKIMEYAKDLEEWLLAGTASTLNTKLACELVQDMLNKLDSSSGPASIYFSHSTTLQLFLTALGIAADATPLRADNYEQMANRKWQTSQISPFTTNVAAVRYDCASGPKIQFFLNERPIVDLDWCVNGLCDLTDVKQRFANFASADCSSYFCSN